MAGGPQGGGHEVIFETTRLGPYMKVTAFDPVSLVEVSVQGPANARDIDLKKLAYNKLRLAIEKKKKP
jgi:hypothetical protein